MGYMPECTGAKTRNRRTASQPLTVIRAGPGTDSDLHHQCDFQSYTHDPRCSPFHRVQTVDENISLMLASGDNIFNTLNALSIQCTQFNISDSSKFELSTAFERPL